MSSDQNFAIQIKDLRKSFGTNDVLKGISLSIPRGTVFALLGPNGAGKTTIVRILSTLLKVDGGSASVGGYDVSSHPDQVRGIIGLTGQYAAVDEKLTGRENLEIIGQLYHISAKDAKRRAQELLERFELVEAAGRAVKKYSGGMRRRLDLAASLIVTPPIIFLDEPTTGLDPNSRNTMWKIIKELVHDGATIMLTTQYLEEADQLADRIAVIDKGVVIAEGTADELKDKVGREQLEVVMETDEDFSKAVAELGAQANQQNASTRTMQFPVEHGVHQLRSILDQFDEAHINVKGIATHRPTLDDVFIKLTGHEAEEKKSDDEEKKQS
ncbi:MAG: ATP-binding cassette domain-containing protein [Candidatus Kerfeldbacteria bacterium]|nr:ATP-binding cassette domain-containing protein [Candidatus Kerfeldbacteria bacterium]